MFGHGGMPVSHNPFLMKLCRLLVGEPGSNRVKRLRRAGGLGKRDRDGLGAELFWGEEVYATIGHDQAF